MIKVFCFFFILTLFYTSIINLGFWLSSPLQKPIPSDLIVILGGDNGARAQRAISLYKLNFASKILLTGLNDGTVSSEDLFTHWRTKQLLLAGVSQKSILFDFDSHSTYEEAVLVLNILKKYNWRSVIVISDPPHLKRVSFAFNLVFKNTSYSFSLSPSVSPSWHASRWWDSNRWAIFSIKEVAKYFYYFLKYQIIFRF